MKERDKTQEKKGFSKRFKEALNLRGHSAKSLAELKEMFGVSRTLIHQWNTAESIPSIYTASIISKELDVSYEWLLLGKGCSEGYQIQTPEEIIMVAQFRNLTKTGKLKLMSFAFDEGKAHEKKLRSAEDKQIALKLIKKTK